jgi:hypothetical protein
LCRLKRAVANFGIIAALKFDARCRSRVMSRKAFHDLTAQVTWPSILDVAEAQHASHPLAHGRREKPRHVFREAGLVITSDLCPVTPGSCTRRVAALVHVKFCALVHVKFCVNVRLVGRVINVLELGRRTVPSPFGGGRTDSWVVSSASSASLLINATNRRLRKECTVPRSGHRGYSTQRCDERHFERLTLRLAKSRAVPSSRTFGKYLRRCVPRMQWGPSVG